MRKISLQANQLTQQGAIFLAKALLHNRTIRSLNLSQNHITNEGLFFLRDALLTNKTANELILRNCSLTDQAAIALAEFIAESSTIQYIDLRENNIQTSGICGIAIAIKKNKSLLKIDFDPIASTPTNLGSLSNNMNQITSLNSFLSLANLRRMTMGVGSFTGSTPSSSDKMSGDGDKEELIEQKARWMNDITAVCQRNILIHEEKLRLQEEERRQQQEQNRQIIDDLEDTNRKDPNIMRAKDIELKGKILDSNESNENISSIVTDAEHFTSTIQNNSEEISQ